MTGTLSFASRYLAKRLKRSSSRVSVIWESPTFPDYQFTIRGDVDKQFGPGFKDRVRQAIVSLDDPEILGYFARSKFIPASNGEYAPIEEVAAAAKLD